MKVQLVAVKAEFRETRALEPHMIGKPFLVDSRLADFIETRSKGRLRRVDLAPAESHIPEPKRRGRPPKTPANGKEH